jgi:hypothetical protein
MLRVLLLAFGLSVVAAQADELPKNLLLMCEGKETVITNPPTLNLVSKPFSVTLRLKDGTIGNIDYNFPDGKDCALSNGKILCELDRVVPFDPVINSTEKRHGLVSIVRETGEYAYVLETWAYPGKTATGKPTSNMKLRMSGICRPVGNPVF